MGFGLFCLLASDFFSPVAPYNVNMFSYAPEPCKFHFNQCRKEFSDDWFSQKKELGWIFAQFVETDSKHFVF